MMNTMRGFFNPNHLDQSSRANDVIVVRHRDGSLHSTPFNVRFGRVQIWNSADKVVQVEVNGELTAAFMKIGDGGEAYWLQPTYARAQSTHASSHPPGDKHRSDAAAKRGTLPGILGSSAGVSGSPGDEGSSASSLVGTDFSFNDDFSVRPESPVDLFEAQTHALTAESAAHATVLDEMRIASREGSTDDTTKEVNGGSCPTQEGRRTQGLPETARAADGDREMTSDDATPLLQGDAKGRYKVVREAIHSAGDAQEANLALQAMAAAEKAEKRLSSMMPVDPYLKEQALHEFPAAAAAASATEPVTRGAPGDHPASASMASRGASRAGSVPPQVPPPQPGSALAVELAAATCGREDEPLDLNAAQRDDVDDTLEAGGDEYYLEPLDIADYVGLYGEDDLLENTSFTTADYDAPAGPADAQGQPRGAHAKAGKGPETSAESGATTSSNQMGKPTAGSDAQSSSHGATAPRHQKNSATTTTTLAKAGKTGGDRAENPYFTRTLIPVQADLVKLNLKDGCNYVRYLTRKSPNSEDAIAVTCNIFLWDYRDRIVVSDVDGTITKSDLWGHFYSMLGKGGDWTHPGICSLYAKIAANGYRMVYLTARSVTQIHQTKEYLWTLDQEGVRLPLGPVLTVPQRFFTALTQEVSKRSHIFKIACLTSLKDAFPPGMKPFFAGFGNRYNDVLSYDAVGVPQHKIFIIDPSSVLHVARVKQTYPNLAKLVDVTFPPTKHHHARRTHAPIRHAPFQGTPGSGVTSNAGSGSVYGSSDDDEEFYSRSPASLEESSELLAAPASMSAAFTMVGNDLSRAELNPNHPDEYHSLSPAGLGSASPSADDVNEHTVPGAAQPLTAEQAALVAGLSLTSGTVITGKVAPAGTASGTASASSGAANITLARGIVVQGGKTTSAASTGLFVRPPPLSNDAMISGGNSRPHHTASSRPAVAPGSSGPVGSPPDDDVEEDADFSGYNFWRVDPRDIVASARGASTPAAATKGGNAKGQSAVRGAAASSTSYSAGTAAQPRQNPPLRGTVVPVRTDRPQSSSAATEKGGGAASRGSQPSVVYSPTTARQYSTSPATDSAVVRVEDDKTTATAKKAKGVGGGLFSFGFGRNNGPSASEKKKAEAEAAALAAAKQRANMHPDSLDYYFSNNNNAATQATSPSSGSGATAARALAEHARLSTEAEDAVMIGAAGKVCRRTSAEEVSAAWDTAAAEPTEPVKTRSTSPSSWAFWRRGNNQNDSSKDALTSQPEHTSPLLATNATVAVDDTNEEQAGTTADTVTRKPVEPAAAPISTRNKDITLDELFEM